MAKKKAAYLTEDPPLMKSFDMACPHAVKQKSVRAIDSPVRCVKASMHCETCGWNPQIQRAILAQYVGEEQADKLMERSAELREKTEKEIMAGGYPYV